MAGQPINLPVTLGSSAINTSKERLTAYVSVRSMGGTSLFDANASLTERTIGEFFSELKLVHAACRRLQEKGFEIERVSRLNIRISGPAAMFEKRVGLKFKKFAHAGLGALRNLTEATRASLPFVPTAATLGNLMDPIIPDIEGMVFPQPVKLYAEPAANPPDAPYHHLSVPYGVALMMNAAEVHK